MRWQENCLPWQCAAPDSRQHKPAGAAERVGRDTGSNQ